METMHDVFICPACGYFCEGPWPERDPDQGPGTLFYFTGIVQIAAARQSPLQTLCFHADGTGSYGGAETGASKGTMSIRPVTPAEARELLEGAAPISDLLPVRTLEDAALKAMAGILADHLYTYVTPEEYPEDFALIYDRLCVIPETSPLASMYAEEDPALRRLQDFVLDILMEEEALREALREAVIGEGHTIFMPDELQVLIDTTRPDRFSTEEDDSEPV